MIMYRIDGTRRLSQAQYNKRYYAKPGKREMKCKANAAYYAANKESLKLKRCLK